MRLPDDPEYPQISSKVEAKTALILRLLKDCFQSRTARLGQCFGAEFPSNHHLHRFANRVVHVSEKCVRGIAHFTRLFSLQLWPEFRDKQFPQFRQMFSKYF